MAKGKGNHSSEGGVAINNSSTGADVLPQIEESAFAGLRQKIEQRLKDQNAARKPKNNKAKATPNDTPKKNSDPAPKPATKRIDADKNNKGKKRDRNGEVIAREDKNTSRKGMSSNSKEVDPSDALRQEILALGGTEDDYDMLAGVDSESEVDDAKNTSKSKSEEDALRKELSGILAAAGQVVPDDIADDEEDELAEEEEEEEEEEEREGEQSDVEDDGDNDGEEQEQVELDESLDEGVPPVPAAKESAKKEKTKQFTEPVLPKEYSKLVSIFVFTLPDAVLIRQ
jgi:ribosome biogenesis protein MAK21